MSEMDGYEPEAREIRITAASVSIPYECETGGFGAITVTLQPGER